MNVRLVLSSAVCTLAFAINALAAEGGTVKGSVKYDGEPPVVEEKKLPGDHPATCKTHATPNEELVVDKESKGIQWAIVRIMDVKAEDPKEPFAEATIDQQKCRFIPHALILPPNTNLNVLNGDGIAHNFHVIPIDGLNKEINRQMPQEKMVIKGKSFAENELLQIKCDIHGWMVAYAAIHDPRFAAVTGTNGSFEIKDVPPGKYKIKIFQEKLGEKEVEVEVKAGATADVGEVKFKK